jgi:hypothetical protein
MKRKYPVAPGRKRLKPQQTRDGFLDVFYVDARSSSRFDYLRRMEALRLFGQLVATAALICSAFEQRNPVARLDICSFCTLAVQADSSSPTSPQPKYSCSRWEAWAFLNYGMKSSWAKGILHEIALFIASTGVRIRHIGGPDCDIGPWCDSTRAGDLRRDGDYSGLVSAVRILPTRYSD